MKAKTIPDECDNKQSIRHSEHSLGKEDIYRILRNTSPLTIKKTIAKEKLPTEGSNFKKVKSPLKYS